MVYDGAVHAARRGEGEAMVHAGKVPHAVTRMAEGNRYTLILFFHIPADRLTQSPATKGSKECSGEDWLMPNAEGSHDPMW